MQTTTLSGYAKRKPQTFQLPNTEIYVIVGDHYDKSREGKMYMGFLFAYPDCVVVGMQARMPRVSSSSPKRVNLTMVTDHPQMISRKASSMHYHQIFHASAVWDILTSQR